MLKNTLIILALVALLHVRATSVSPIAPDNCHPTTTCNDTSYADYDWTRGVIKPADADVFDKDFMYCQYPRYLCGWVPGKKEGSEYYVSPSNKGVQLSLGVDMGAMDQNEFNFTIYNFSGAKPGFINATLGKIKRHWKVQGARAARLLMEYPFELTEEEESTIFEAFSRKKTRALEEEYNAEKAPNSTEFANLPFGLKTALTSFSWQFGSVKSKSSDLWNSLLKNDWVGVIQAYDKGKFEDPVKRKREKQIILAATQKCSKSLDVAFLIDESGSVTADGFTQAKGFLSQFVRAQETIGPKDTRVAITTYDDTPRHIIPLNSSFDKDTLLKQIDALSYHGQGTQTGKAMKEMLDRIEGQRRSAESISMALIGITDGGSDNTTFVEEQAHRAKSLGIITIAVGVGSGVKDEEMMIIAGGDKDRRYEIKDYAALDKFIQALSASSCSLRLQPVKGQQLTGTIKSPIEPVYYEVAFNYTQNLQLSLNVTSGNENAVQMYLSFKDKYPDALSFDKSHSGYSDSSLKELVVMAPEHKDEFENQPENVTTYIAVTGEANLTYTILIAECDPIECKPGSNESNGKGGSGGSSLWILFTLLGLAVVGGIGYYVFIRYKQRMALLAAEAEANKSPYAAYNYS